MNEKREIEVEEKIKNGFDRSSTRFVWDEDDGKYRKYMWNNFVERWCEV